MREASSESTASVQGPLSICTSTLVMPRVWAHAVPPMATFPAGTLAKDLGTSTRAMVLIGPRSDQPRWVQYALLSANRVTSRSTTHLVAETKPYSPGTTIRTG